MSYKTMHRVNGAHCPVDAIEFVRALVGLAAVHIDSPITSWEIDEETGMVGRDGDCFISTTLPTDDMSDADALMERVMSLAASLDQPIVTEKAGAGISLAVATPPLAIPGPGTSEITRILFRARFCNFGLMAATLHQFD